MSDIKLLQMALDDLEWAKLMIQASGDDPAELDYTIAAIKNRLDLIMPNEDSNALKQAVVNYRELWNDFLTDIDDGRWNRSEVEQNIAACKKILGIDHVN